MLAVISTGSCVATSVVGVVRVRLAGALESGLLLKVKTVAAVIDINKSKIKVILPLFSATLGVFTFIRRCLIRRVGLGIVPLLNDIGKSFEDLRFGRNL